MQTYVEGGLVKNFSSKIKNSFSFFSRRHVFTIVNLELAATMQLIQYTYWYRACIVLVVALDTVYWYWLMLAIRYIEAKNRVLALQYHPDTWCIGSVLLGLDLQYNTFVFYWTSNTIHRLEKTRYWPNNPIPIKRQVLGWIVSVAVSLGLLCDSRTQDWGATRFIS
jgi:hypothetical protein